MAGSGWRRAIRALRFWSPQRALEPPPNSPVAKTAAADDLASLLFGRDGSLEDVAAREVGTVVLAGDPGVGKTQLATHAAKITLGAPAPASLSYRQGALQTALFSSLADALAIDAASRGSTEVFSPE